jgi:hypothetical protein
MTCPYCKSQNEEGTLICATCWRDIAVPETLLAEREDLLRKRDLAREQLRQARAELQMLRPHKRSP